MTTISKIYVISYHTKVYLQLKLHLQNQIRTPNTNRQYRYRFLKSFYSLYKKKAQHQNSERAISIYTNDVLSVIYSYLSILELRETKGDSPTQTSRHTTVR